MSRLTIFLLALVCSGAAFAVDLEGVLYDANGTRIGPVAPFGSVYTQVGGRIVRLPIGPIGSDFSNSVPPDVRQMGFRANGYVHWAGANCTGTAYIEKTTDWSSGEVLSAVVVAGKTYLFSASPTDGGRSALVQSARISDEDSRQANCVNYSPQTLTSLVKVDSRIDLSTIFALPFQLR